MNSKTKNRGFYDVSLNNWENLLTTLVFRRVISLIITSSLLICNKNFDFSETFKNANNVSYANVSMPSVK